MTVTIGHLVCDDSLYDRAADVLYLSVGSPEPAGVTHATPEGHAVRLGEDGTVAGLTLVNVKWLLERDGKLVITLPERIETAAETVAAALR